MKTSPKWLPLGADVAVFFREGHGPNSRRSSAGPPGTLDSVRVRSFTMHYCALPCTAAFVASLCFSCGPVLPKPGQLGIGEGSAGQAGETEPCKALRPQTEPDLMGWDAGSRAKVDRLQRGTRGVVALHRHLSQVRIHTLLVH